MRDREKRERERETERRETERTEREEKKGRGSGLGRVTAAHFSGVSLALHKASCSLHLFVRLSRLFTGSRGFSRGD